MANEKRLIDANALDFDFPVTDDLIEMGIEMVRARVVTAPTVDAVEVVHGRWVNVQTLGSGCVGFCSNCMTPHKANNATALRMDYRHCRWCGAKMDGDGNG